jgi:hypothetical protein
VRVGDVALAARPDREGAVLRAVEDRAHVLVLLLGDRAALVAVDLREARRERIGRHLGADEQAVAVLVVLLRELGERRDVEAVVVVGSGCPRGDDERSIGAEGRRRVDEAREAADDPGLTPRLERVADDAQRARQYDLLLAFVRPNDRRRVRARELAAVAAPDLVARVASSSASCGVATRISAFFA